jgi:hypothetical protein
MLNMGMKFIDVVKQRSGCATQYAFAKKLGISIQSVQYILGVTARPRTRKSIDPRLLCKLRKVGGLTWEQLGKLLDREFGDKTD